MTTTTVDISETPTQLADLLSLALTGTEVIIAEGGKTLARLVPVAQNDQRIGNLHPGSIETSDDFDAPLPDEFWAGNRVRLLLDTHIFIWWNGNLSLLSPQVRALCEDKANTLVLSVASIWEMQIKFQLGKLTFHQPLAEIIAGQQRANGLEFITNYSPAYLRPPELAIAPQRPV